MKEDSFPHWGICHKCGLRLDLNDDLLCKSCAKALVESLARLRFVQVKRIPKGFKKS